MKKIPDDPLADPRFADLVRCLRAAPAPQPALAGGWTDRLVAEATGSDPLGERTPFADTLRALRSLPITKAPDGLADRIVAAAMESDREERRLRLRRFFRVVQVAAAVALLATGLHLFFAGRGGTPESARVAAAAPQTPLQILLAAQRADGAFAADEDSTGVTALAVLALLYNGPTAGEVAENAIAAGLDHLVAVQHEDGTFADGHHAANTDYLAIKALQAAQRLPQAKPEWLVAAARGLPHLPEPAQVAALNRQLAHPEAAWSDVQAPAVPAALALLRR